MAVSAPSLATTHAHVCGDSLYDKLNSKWHKPALLGFMAIVLGHWGEHLVQAYQIYVMGWPPAKAGGMLGLWYPGLIKS